MLLMRAGRMLKIALALVLLVFLMMRTHMRGEVTTKAAFKHLNLIRERQCLRQKTVKMPQVIASRAHQSQK